MVKERTALLSNRTVSPGLLRRPGCKHHCHMECLRVYQHHLCRATLEELYHHHPTHQVCRPIPGRVY